MQKLFVIVVFVALITYASAGSYCLTKLNAAQTAFNTKLGLNVTLNWNNVDSLWNVVQGKYMSDPPYGFHQVCAAVKEYKKSFQPQLSDYIRCTKVIELIIDDNNTATNVPLQNALNYFGLIASFDFTCGAGFGLFANNAPCISSIFANSSEALTKCRKDLAYQLTNGSPLMQCDYIEDSFECVRKVFRPCGQTADYFGCEYARTPSVNMFPQCASVSTNCLVTNYGN